MQRRSEEVIISGHVAALVRCQHLHHGLVTISHSKVQGGPTLVVLPVQQGLGGSCLLDAHNTADTVRRMKKKKKINSAVCACLYQNTADGLCGAGLLTVCSPVQRDLALTVWDANVGIVLDQETNVFWSVIKC